MFSDQPKVHTTEVLLAVCKIVLVYLFIYDFKAYICTSYFINV